MAQDTRKPTGGSLPWDRNPGQGEGTLRRAGDPFLGSHDPWTYEAAASLASWPRKLTPFPLLSKPSPPASR